MIAERVIFDRLAKDAAVSGIVDSRVYPAVAPAATEQQGSYIVYTLSSTDRTPYMQGEAGLATRTYTVECCASSYDGAAELAESVRLVFDSWRGDYAAMRVRRVTFENESDNFTRNEDGSDSGVYVRVLTIAIVHTEEPTALPAGT